MQNPTDYLEAFDVDPLPCKCGAAGREKHPCPFNEELGGGNRECNCCFECTRECAYDI